MTPSNNEPSTLSFMLPYLMGGLTVLFFYWQNGPHNEIPHVDEVQKGFIAPSKIEIKVQDLDKTDEKGLKETYFKLTEGNHTDDYVLIYNEYGKPEIRRYHFDPGLPAKVTPSTYMPLK